MKSVEKVIMTVVNRQKGEFFTNMIAKEIEKNRLLETDVPYQSLRVYVSDVLHELEKQKSIEMVGTEQGKGPLPKKLYRKVKK
jgi:hypothetical protein